MLGSDCRVRLNLANGDSALYPVKRIGLLMRQMGYSKPALLGNTVKGTGYAPLKTEIARRAAGYGCNISADDILITNGCIEAISPSPARHDPAGRCGRRGITLLFRAAADAA